jgi:transposase
MRQVREILRLKHERGLSHRAIARACGVGLGTVSEYGRRAQRAALTWPLPPTSTNDTRVTRRPSKPKLAASILLLLLTP